LLQKQGASFTFILPFTSIILVSETTLAPLKNKAPSKGYGQLNY